MSDPTVLTTLRSAEQGTICTVILNRPAALNSFTAAMHGALIDALDTAAADTDVRCLVLTGAGRGFCAGQDLADLSGSPGSSPADLGDVLERRYVPLVRRLRAMPVPVIAEVNGVAAGAGANLALACDVVIAGRSASFVQASSRIGLIPDAGGTWLLPRLAGRARALGLAMLGDKLSAEDAQQMGLIWRCVPDASLTDEVHCAALRLAALPTKALVATRHALDAAQNLAFDDALAQEVRIQRALGRAHDYIEGVAAFLAKGVPRFDDR